MYVTNVIIVKNLHGVCNLNILAPTKSKANTRLFKYVQTLRNVFY